MKILVIDDELLIRNSIVQKLHAMGFCDVLDDSNGKDGYETILSQEPQLIIADIRMPGLDGISLLQLLRKTQLNTLFIILSGYDLFQYAQTAIQEGAFRYLLKPVNWNEFEESVLAAKREVEKQILLKKERSKLKSHFEQSKRVLIGRLLSDWVFRRNSDPAVFWHNADELGLIFPYDGFFMAVFQIVQDGTSHSSLSTILFELEAMIRNILQVHNIEGACFVMQTRLCFVCNFSTQRHISHSCMIDLFHEIEYECRKSIDPHIFAGIGKTCALENLPENYEAAMAIVDAQICADHAAKVSSQEKSNIAKLLMDRCKEPLTQCILQNKSEDAMHQVDVAFEPFCFEFAYEKKERNNFCLYIIVLCKGILDQLQQGSSNALGDEFELYHQASDLETPGEVVAWLKNFIHQTIQLVHCQNADNLEAVAFVSDVKQYIQIHFQEPISLKTAAEYFNYTPTYFSSLFKREVGSSFVKYLTACRYNEAKRLLLETTLSVPVIAKRVGCNDYKHFLQTFKKITGFTPTTYREQFQKR